MIADRLRLYRGLRGLSQRQLAERANVDTTTVWRIEGGQQEPGATTLQALAEALAVPYGALLGTEVYIPEEVVET